ncbi:hypothetical protein ACHAWO_009184 [Cyclotella atomus]|uniref:Helicase-associated domain-containing protein n=1 Tax=Cyclotella atomus TaxID=382360 RepID=A0ABD3NUH6_9STRA
MKSARSDDESELMEAPADINEAEAKIASSTPRKRHKFEVWWDEKLKELKEYKSLHGDCSVPIMSEQYGKLGKWCENQRFSFNKGKLAQDRIDRLREAGFVFEGNIPRSPEKRFPSYDKLRMSHIDELKEFIQEFGHANVPPTYSINPQLGKWVENTRGKHNRGELPDDRVNELAEAGFNFETPLTPDKYHSYAYDHRWDERFKELMDYKNEHGDFKVRPSHNYALNKWIENQKQSYRKGRLSEERTARLEGVGFSFAKAVKQPKSSENVTQPDEIAG